MAQPVPLKQTSTTSSNSTYAPVPVDLSGLSTPVPTFTEITGTVANTTGANLQAILEDLATRVNALENP